MSTFWLDHEYDRERAEDGSSRYGGQVRREAAAFHESWGDIAPVTFACTAWRLATPPVLSPGYVRWHRRILDAICVRKAPARPFRPRQAPTPDRLFLAIARDLRRVIGVVLER